MYSHCHQMVTQQQPKGPQGLLEVSLKSQFISQPMPAWEQPNPHHLGPIGGLTMENWR